MPCEKTDLVKNFFIISSFKIPEQYLDQDSSQVSNDGITQCDNSKNLLFNCKFFFRREETFL